MHFYGAGLSDFRGHGLIHLRRAKRYTDQNGEARAQGELGMIAFLHGNTGSAMSLLGRAILSAYKTGDIGSQVRLLSMLGNGFVEQHRFDEVLAMFRRAIELLG